MNPQDSQKSLSSLHVRAVLVLGVVLVACFIIGRGIALVPGKAQTSQQQSAALPPGQEKRLENNIPRHLPIKVKVNDLNSKKWVDDLEIEVTNTSEKPIYFLLFYVVIPELKSPQGHKIAFRMLYGRLEMIDFSNPIKAEDVPLQPGATQVFKVEESSSDDFEGFKAHTHQLEPKRIELVFSGLRFGDGTGYSDADGRPIDIHKKVSFSKPPVPRPNGPRILSHTTLFPSYRQAFCR